MTTVRHSLALTLFAILLVTGCASGPPKPTVDYKQDYNFQPVGKIAFYDESGQVSGDNPLQLSDMQIDRIDEALAYALRNKGMEVVSDGAEADLLLSWHLVTQHKTDVRTYETPAYGVGYGRYGGYNRYSMYSCWSCTTTDVRVSNYTEGTFIVDMIDPRLRKSVWRGVIQSRLKGDMAEEQSKLNAAATAIFATFPPQGSPE